MTGATLALALLCLLAPWPPQIIEFNLPGPMTLEVEITPGSPQPPDPDPGDPEDPPAPTQQPTDCANHAPQVWTEAGFSASPFETSAVQTQLGDGCNTLTAKHPERQ